MPNLDHPVVSVTLNATIVDLARKFAEVQAARGHEPATTRSLIEYAILQALVLSCADIANVPMKLTRNEVRILDPNGNLGIL